MNIPSAHLWRSGGILLTLSFFFMSLSLLPVRGVSSPASVQNPSISHLEAVQTKPILQNESRLTKRTPSTNPPSMERPPLSASAEIRWEDYPSFEVVATGYTAGFESTGKHPHDKEYGITYSGVKVRRDRFSTIAADIRRFPIGSILYIPAYGYGVVADKGSAIRGNKIDLYFETVEDVYKEWGKRRVKVYLIKWGDGILTEEMLTRYNEAPTQEVFHSITAYPKR